MKTHIIEQVGEGRWTAIENALAPRFAVLALIVLLLGYGIVGALDKVSGAFQ